MCILTIWFVKGTDLIGEDAGEADVEIVDKQEADVICKETVKNTESSLSDTDKLKRPKRKKKKYVHWPRLLSTTMVSSRHSLTVHWFLWYQLIVTDVQTT